jgi:hypothetical protein
MISQSSSEIRSPIRGCPLERIACLENRLTSAKEVFEMYCPDCRAEYREGIETCPDCEVRLVVELPPVDPDADLVPVFETADVSLLPVVESVLDSARIPYLVQGEEALSVLPVGRWGAGISQSGRGLAATIRVEKGRAEEAEELLRPLAEGESPSEPEEG